MFLIFRRHFFRAQLKSFMFQLHIHMFTDVNFFLKGFNATYSINKCPNNCSGHGQCKPVESGGYKCQCQQYPVYVGKDCSFRQCAEKCWAHKAQGECARTFDVRHRFLVFYCKLLFLFMNVSNLFRSLANLDSFASAIVETSEKLAP